MAKSKRLILDLEERASCEVSFGLRARSLFPATVSSALGLSPTKSHARGDYLRPDSRHPAPHGVWSLSSAGLTPSKLVSDHVVAMLSLLEPRRAVIESYLAIRDWYLAFWVLWTTADVVGGYTIPADLLRRMSSLARDVNFSFDYRRPPDEIESTLIHIRSSNGGPEAN